MLLLLVLGQAACKHDPDGDPIDALLLEMARNTNGHVWYKNSDALLPRSIGSAHNQAFLRTRYDAIAAGILDENGQVVTDTVFPVGSLIVKELWDDASTLSLYAILYKRPDDQNADIDGWVWGYVQPDGTARQPASNQGSACRSCHGQADNIDFSLMNKFFP